MINGYYSASEINQLESQLNYLESDTRFNLWSIIDIMERFYAEKLGSALATLLRLLLMISVEDAKLGNFDRNELSKQFVGEFIENLKEVRLSRVLKEQITRASLRITKDSCGVTEIHTMFREIHNNIIVEFRHRWFLEIPEEKRHYYEQRSPLFGMNVANVFPSATSDIAAASRCLALDEWTACVFHLMRVLEIGLHEMAKTVGLSETEIGFENWKIIIDQIEKKTKEFDELTPKSATKSKTLQFYSELATNFRLFKDAWRNHVSHSRTNYDERDAIIIYNNVQAFMQTLAKYELAKRQS